MQKNLEATEMVHRKNAEVLMQCIDNRQLKVWTIADDQKKEDDVFRACYEKRQHS